MQKITILFFIISITGFSQSISKQVIGPGGQTYENGNNKLSYTLGEVAVGAMTDEDGTYQLGNGYYPSLDLTPLSIETPDLDLKIKVFPNPSKEVIFITHPTEQFFNLSISDVSGKQILQTVHQKEQPLNVQTLTIGTYFITVTTKESKQTNTYKVIKQ